MEAANDRMSGEGERGTSHAHYFGTFMETAVFLRIIRFVGERVEWKRENKLVEAYEIEFGCYKIYLFAIRKNVKLLTFLSVDIIESMHLRGVGWEKGIEGDEVEEAGGRKRKKKNEEEEGAIEEL